jgi:hypothetical protein
MLINTLGCSAVVIQHQTILIVPNIALNEDRKELKKKLMNRMQHPDAIEKKGSILCKQKYSE